MILVMILVISYSIYSTYGKPEKRGGPSKARPARNFARFAKATGAPVG